MTKREFDHAIARLAAEQHGAFSVRQAIALGANAPMRRRRVAAGLWRDEGGRGVYTLAGSQRTVAQRLVVAILDSGGDAVACRQSAAGVLHVPSFTLGGEGLHVLVPSCRAHETKRARVHRTTFLPEHHVCVVDGVRTTTLARTVCDLAICLDARRLGRVVDDLLVTGRITVAEISEVCDELAVRGRPGIPLLRRVLAYRSEEAYVPPESELERRFLELIRSAGLPEPTLQAAPPWRTMRPQRLDFTWQGTSLLIVETDGRRWHTRCEDLERDHVRDRLAAREGAVIVHVLWEHLRHGKAQTIDDLRAIMVNLGIVASGGDVALAS